MKCGIVDVGSNTMRLSVYHYEGRQFKLLMNKKEMAGLASYIQDGALSDSGILVACRVLSNFKALLENLNIGQIYVFGTAPLRNISNTEDALDTIQTITGLRVDVLSGADEAKFSFLGATSDEHTPSSGLLVDIGGGSTELVAYQDWEVRSECSLPMGSLSLYSKYVSGLFPTPEERRAIRDQVERELHRAKTAGLTCSHVTGVGGTVRAAAKLCNRLADADPDNRIIPATDIRSLYKNLKKGDVKTLRQILLSTPDRVHTVLPGLAILTTVLKFYEADTVSASSCGVREGYLLSRIMGVESRA